ncbi:MAG: porin [Neptuniibacter sp.]
MTQSATAATLYENNGLTFKMKGDWQIQLREHADNSKEMDVEFDDFEIKNSVIYDLGENLQAFGQLDFSFDKAAEDGTDGSKLEEAYLGVRFGDVATRVGKMNTSADEFGVEAAYEKPAGVGEDQFERIKDSGDDVIRVDAEFGNATLSVSHEVEANDGDDSATDLFLSADLDTLSIAAAFQTVDNTADSWGVSASFKAGFATIGADYSVSDIEGQSDDDTTVNLVAKFKAAATTSVALGFVNYEKNGTDTDAWYANVSYKFPAQKNVKLFAEISDSDAGDSADILAGMQIKF